MCSLFNLPFCVFIVQPHIFQLSVVYVFIVQPSVVCVFIVQPYIICVRVQFSTIRCFCSVINFPLFVFISQIPLFECVYCWTFRCWFHRYTFRLLCVHCSTSCCLCSLFNHRLFVFIIQPFVICVFTMCVYCLTFRCSCFKVSSLWHIVTFLKLEWPIGLGVIKRRCMRKQPHPKEIET